MSRATVGHRHKANTWHHASRWDRDLNCAPNQNPIRIYKRAGVEVLLEQQERYLYPKGEDVPACCVESRTVIRVEGTIGSAALAFAVAKEIEQHRHLTRAPRRMAVR